MYDVTVIGPSVIDILAAPFDPEALAKGKRDVDQIRMSFGGDALNESVVLSRMGKSSSKHKYPYHQHHLFGCCTTTKVVYSLHQWSVAE